MDENLSTIKRSISQESDPKSQQKLLIYQLRIDPLAKYAIWCWLFRYKNWHWSVCAARWSTSYGWAYKSSHLFSLSNPPTSNPRTAHGGRTILKHRTTQSTSCRRYTDIQDGKISYSGKLHCSYSRIYGDIRILT